MVPDRFIIVLFISAKCILQSVQNCIDLFISDHDGWFDANGVSAGQCSGNQYTALE